MQQNMFFRVLSSAILAGFVFSPVTAMPAFAASKVVSKKVTKKRRYRSVSAIPGADETNIVNPTSRCLTKDMKATDARAVAQMNADIKKANAEGSQQAETYKEKLTVLWAAMEEPYCGYGKGRVATAKKSFLKTVERTRAEFFASVKKGLTPATGTANVTQASSEAPVVSSGPVDNPLHITF